jgi:hypothetical protein
MGICECKLCKRNIRFSLLVDKITDEKDKEFFVDIYSDLLNNEFEVDLLQLKVEELRKKLK